MRAPSLTRLALDDLWRRRRLLGGGAVGIALAIGLTTFLAALGTGLRSAVVDSMFPLDRLEVAPKPLALGMWVFQVQLGSDTLDPARLEQLAAIPGVTAVYPRSVMTAPGVLRGGGPILGAGFRSEIVADGLPAAALADDLGANEPAFVDPDELADRATACEADSDCPTAWWCRRESNRAPGECRATIPVVVSRQLVKVYDDVLRRAFRLPKLDLESAQGLELWVRFGESWVDRRRLQADPVDERLRIVGFSDLAVPLGVTMPLATVQRLNRRFEGERAGQAVHGAVLALDSPRHAAAVMAAVEALGLEAGDRGARRAAGWLAVLVAALLVIGATVLAVAVLGVSHLFALIVTVRRRELGIWRVVGARPWQVSAVLAGQGALVGGAAGLVGGTAARLAALGVDAALGHWVPTADLLPPSVFAGWAWLLPAAVAVAAAAAAVGAAAPTLGVVRTAPANLLRD